MVVKSDDTAGALAGGFGYTEPYEVIRVEPREGSIAGNTHVTIFGRGLDLPAAVRFGGNAGLLPTLENGSVLAVRTQPAGTGRVDVAVTTGAQATTLARAFSFYDPKLLTGGAWGGPIEGSVNVAVLDPNSGNGVAGATVQLGYGADPRYQATTDENGLATISSPEIPAGPYTVTAGKNGFEFVAPSPR